MSHTDLSNYYKTIFALVKHHGFNEDTLENKYPFELDLTVQMVMNYLKEIDEKRRNQAGSTPTFSDEELLKAGVDPKSFAPGELEKYR